MASLPARAGAAGLPAVWLRDNCRCAGCLDPVSGQRLRTVTDLPAGLTVSDISVADGQVTVRFQPDGHRAVFDQAWLARHAAGPDPAGFTVLATTPVTFSYRDEHAELSATRPLISLDPRGRIREIRCNGRALQPPCLGPAEAAGFYTAYRAFAELAGDPAAQRTARLAPGDCVVFDTRDRKGRTDHDHN